MISIYELATAFLGGVIVGSLAYWLGYRHGVRVLLYDRPIEMEHSDNVAEVLVAAERLVDNLAGYPNVSPDAQRLTDAVHAWQATHEQMTGCIV